MWHFLISLRIFHGKVFMLIKTKTPRCRRYYIRVEKHIEISFQLFDLQEKETLLKAVLHL